MNSTLNIRIDEKTKKDAHKTFKKMGLDFSSGVKIFLRQVINTQSIPFRVITENGFTPEQEMEMVKQAKKALKYGKSYSSIKKLHDDILKSK
ncbi:MAG: type II toxin-antitoxin system RelB/DinJ family antitoxin [Patescibacteria group bacterium]